MVPWLTFDMSLDEETLRVRVKSQLRKRLRQLRQGTPQKALESRSARIVEHLLTLSAWSTATRVALFWPMKGKREVDIGPADAAARAANKRVAYPFMRPKDGGYSTGFAWVDNPEQLADRGRGFPEPPPSAAVAEGNELDLIVVPALGVAPTGHRLGFGRGWYDATLGEFRPRAVLVAVAFDFQMLVELPAEEHDVACDYVVTDERIIEVAAS